MRRRTSRSTARVPPDPAVGDYEQSRGLDVFEEGGNGERLDVNTLVVNYDWDAVSLISASSWTEMKRFSDQDIAFLAEDGVGLPPAVGTARPQRRRAVHAGSAAAVARRAAVPMDWSAPTTSTRRRSSRSSSRTIPVRRASAQVAARPGLRAGRAAREVLREEQKSVVRAGQLRPHRAVDGRRRRSLPRRRDRPTSTSAATAS